MSWKTYFLLFFHIISAPNHIYNKQIPTKNNKE